jgi:glycosyltransferase involved in cell wall biosynthesis
VNILLTSHRFHPDIGGIETISDILARHFTAAGHAVRLITQSPGDTRADRQFPFPVLRHPSARQLLSSVRWADVVLQNNLEVRQLWPLLLCRRPLVIGLQTWIRTVDGERGALQRLKRLALAGANQLIACSNAVRLDSSSEAIVIGNPYNNALFRTIEGLPRRRVIAFLGRLVSDKGADLLLRAFANLQPSGWRLSVIGDGPERPALQRLCIELGINNRVDFYGALQGEALVRVLNHHEILVIPSRWREPFGVVALEGLACGCVVLASDGGGLPDAVGSAGLLFRRDDLSDLTRRLRDLIDSDALRAHLRQKAPSHLVRFQATNVCSQYLSLVEGLRRQPSQLLH